LYPRPAAEESFPLRQTTVADPPVAAARPLPLPQPSPPSIAPTRDGAAAKRVRSGDAGPPAGAACVARASDRRRCVRSGRGSLKRSTGPPD